MRKLVTIKTIDAINPIDGADAIEAAMIGGWAVVVKKDEFKPGDLVLYFEIDSIIPHKIAPFLASYYNLKTYENGVEGYRLKTKRMRGVWSQGLIIPIASLFDVIYENNEVFINMVDYDQLYYRDTYATRNIHNSQ